MLEVLLSLSVFPDINHNDPIPSEERELNVEIPEGVIYKQMQKDREETRNCAQKALRRLKEYNLIERLPFNS